MVARNAAADDPQKREKRHEEAEPEFRALERRRPLEVMEVDALRELLGCPCSCHSLATLAASSRSEEHTSELQSPMYLVCRLLLEKKKYLTNQPLSACRVSGGLLMTNANQN